MTAVQPRVPRLSALLLPAIVAASLLTCAPGPRRRLPAEVHLVELTAGGGGDGSRGSLLRGEPAENLGSSLGYLGDVDGDGRADLLIGSSRAFVTAGPEGPRGAAYILLGRAAPRAERRVRELLPERGGDGSEGFVLRGVGQYDGTGVSVSGVEDLNGDGLDDLIVGAPHADREGEGGGAAYVVFGRRRWPASVELSSLEQKDGSGGFVLRGLGRTWTGNAVTGAGDVNGDGIPDLLVGAPTRIRKAGRGGDLGEPRSTGRAYLVLGRRAFPARLDLASLHPENGGDGSLGSVLEGVLPHEECGRGLAGGGDVDGDGLGDFLVGAPWANNLWGRGAGRVYLVRGRRRFPARLEMADLLPERGGDGSAGMVVEGPSGASGAGFALALGDMNGDGRGDLFIGALHEDRFGPRHGGTVFVVFGRPRLPARLDLALLPVEGERADGGLRIHAAAGFDEVGTSVAAPGDVDGDGYGDLLTGAPWGRHGNPRPTGAAYLVRGGAALPPVIDLGTLHRDRGGDGSRGTVFLRTPSQDRLGQAVTGVGDTDGDRVPDLALGAKWTQDAGGSLIGGVYLIRCGRQPTSSISARPPGMEGSP